MKHSKILLALAGAAAVFASSASALAQQAPKPEQLIKVRQSMFQVIAWNTGRIKANLDGTYNKEEVVKAANALSAVANSGMGALFVPGTEKGKGWHDTAAKAEVFTEAKHFGDHGANFAKEAAELASLAASSDAAAVKAQFSRVTRACKSCHDDFKAKD